MKKSVFILIYFCINSLFAQSNDPVNIINPHYSLQQAALDMADNYGISSGLGLDFMKINVVQNIRIEHHSIEKKIIFSNLKKL